MLYSYQQGNISSEATGLLSHLYYLGLVYFLSILLTFGVFLAASFHLCRDLPLLHALRAIYVPLCLLQGWLLLAFLFCRLYTVFQESAYALSRQTIVIWCIIYLIATCAAGMAAVAYPDIHDQRVVKIGAAFVGLAICLYIVMVLLVNVLFITKLVRVLKNTESTPTFIDVITKTSLLAFISTITTVLFFVLTVISPLVPSFHMGFFRCVLMIGELSTNFWCTLLSYRDFEAWYLTVCCDAKCKKFMWNKVIRKDTKMMAESVEMQGSA